MTRLRRIADRDRVFFITTNLARRTEPLVPSERDLVLDQIGRQHAKNQFLLFGYVVMPDHLHLLIAPKDAGLIVLMREFKSCTGQKIAQLRRNRGPVWQPRYFDFILRRVQDFWKKLEYIHRNPVEANLAARPEDWRWSSAIHYAHAGPGAVPVDPVDLPVDGKTYLWPAPWR